MRSRSTFSLGGEADDVAPARRRGERRGPDGEAVGEQRGPALGERRRRAAELAGLDERGDDQLARRLRRRQRLGETEQRSTPLELARHDQQRPIRRRRMRRGRRTWRPSRQVERRILAQDRLLEPLELLARLEAELVGELAAARRDTRRAPRPGGPSGRARASAGRAGAPSAGARRSAPRARRSARRGGRRPDRRRSAARARPSAAPRAGRSRPGRTARRRGRRAAARATAPAPAAASAPRSSDRPVLASSSSCSKRARSSSERSTRSTYRGTGVTSRPFPSSLRSLRDVDLDDLAPPSPAATAPTARRSGGRPRRPRSRAAAGPRAARAAGRLPSASTRSCSTTSRGPRSRNSICVTPTVAPTVPAGRTGEQAPFTAVYRVRRAGVYRAGGGCAATDRTGRSRPGGAPMTRRSLARSAALGLARRRPRGAQRRSHRPRTCAARTPRMPARPLRSATGRRPAQPGRPGCRPDRHRSPAGRRPALARHPRPRRGPRHVQRPGGHGRQGDRARAAERRPRLGARRDRRRRHARPDPARPGERARSRAPQEERGRRRPAVTG